MASATELHASNFPSTVIFACRRRLPCKYPEQSLARKKLNQLNYFFENQLLLNFVFLKILHVDFLKDNKPVFFIRSMFYDGSARHSVFQSCWKMDQIMGGDIIRRIIMAVTIRIIDRVIINTECKSVNSFFQI